MDYRYETGKEQREFHKKRIAFIIYNSNIEFIKNSEMSHWEYCQTKGFSKEIFNKITRGYFLKDSVVFYKDNFIYDENVIKEGLEYIELIAKECKIESFNIYFGCKIDELQKIWTYDYYYGRYENNTVFKNQIL